jgi:hypothetical protein
MPATYGLPVDQGMIIGSEPLTDGMHIAVRLRRDFTVTDAGLLLAAARPAYMELNPGAAHHDTAQVVTSAADAIFTILEHDGLLGRAVDRALAARADHGLQPDRWRAQVTINEARRLPPGPDCLTQDDVFAQPADT